MVWSCSLAVTATDSGARMPGFKPQPWHLASHVTRKPQFTCLVCRFSDEVPPVPRACCDTPLCVERGTSCKARMNRSVSCSWLLGSMVSILSTFLTLYCVGHLLLHKFLLRLPSSFDGIANSMRGLGPLTENIHPPEGRSGLDTSCSPAVPALEGHPMVVGPQ